MEHKFYTDNFERLLKEQADEFRMYPSKRVWHSIYNDLHPGRKWPSIAVSLILVTVLFLIGYWNNNNNSTGTLAAKPGGNPILAQNGNALRNSSGNTGTIPETTIAGSETTSTERKATPTADDNTGNDNAAGSITSGKLTLKNGEQKNRIAAGRHPQSAVTTSVGNDVNYTTAASSATKQSALTVGAAETGSMDNSNSITLTGSAAATHSITTFNTGNNTNTAITPTTDIAANENEGNEDLSLQLNAVVAPIENLAGQAQLAHAGGLKEPEAIKKMAATSKQLSAEEKSWIEHYSFYNKQARKRWKGRLSSEIFLTPGAGLRSITTNTDRVPAANSSSSMVNVAPANPDATVPYKPGVTFAIGAGVSYAVSKNIRLKAGIQANFTNYSVGVTDINHPVLTTLMLNNTTAGYPYLESRASSLANIPGLNNKRAHNQTSQVSLPLGVAVKMAGNQKLEWYIASSIQPTYVFGGKAYLVSADHNNYIADASFIRKWNVNAAAETYIHYKMNGFTLQAGPEFRRQLISTYSSKYTGNEKLYNIGVKIGLVKNF